jgi:hypothetical protein
MIPPWAMSSVLEWLTPFLTGNGYEAQGSWNRSGRDFIREIERTQRLSLDWRHGPESAQQDLWQRLQREQALLVDVLCFACQNILLGYTFQEYDEAGSRLNRALQQAGTVWEVVPVAGRTGFRMRRRASAATASALKQNTSAGDGASDHLGQAWQHAYGRDPDPGAAYSEAIKAVEAASIPVVVPNDPLATLGKVIGNLRGDADKWRVNLSRPVRLSGKGSAAANAYPIDVVIGQLDLLWTNQSDRHAPVVPITPSQAETAVHLALVLVHMFRSGAIARTT